MKEVDVIILSYSKNEKIIEMTRNCIESIYKSSYTIKHNIHLIESNKNITNEYDDLCINLVIPQEEFNFNKFYNIGLQYCKSEYVHFLNNDILFLNDVSSELIKVFDEHPEWYSLSPWEPKYHLKFHAEVKEFYEGYTIKKYVCGWSIFTKRSLFDIIGPWDELFNFYYQDNDYALTLKKHGLKHILVRSAHLTHLKGKSHKIIPGDKEYDFLMGSKKKLETKWKHKNKSKQLI
jgi:GT2 family glycosyltransferase